MVTGKVHESDWQYKIEMFFVIYIVLQPLLDVTAFFHLPVSDVFRVFVMFLGFFYLLMNRHRKGHQYAILYLFLLGAVLLANLINSYILKNPFFLSIEVIYVIKTAYFAEMLVVYAFVFRSISEYPDWQKWIQRNAYIAMSIIGIVMLIATITGTGRRSYGSLAKEGHSGWFFSANELGAILAMGIGLMLLYLLNRNKGTIKLMLTPLIMLVIWSMLMIGTKVGLGAALIILGIALVIALVETLLDRRNWLNLAIVTPLLILTVFIVPYMPVGNNVDFDVFSKWIGKIDLPLEQSTQLEEENLDEKQNLEVKKELLSGRGDFLRKTWEEYQKAPLSQKLLGMGRGGNYEEVPKLIEMNFFDWFFNFGILGFALLITPMVYLGFLIIKQLCQARFKQLNRTTLLVGAEVVLGLGSAFMAGHILSSPASGIYLAILIGYLYTLTLDKGPQFRIRH
ncbi:MAG TPA: O-antigen ligase family protein [Bacillales bacterium]